MIEVPSPVRGGLNMELERFSRPYVTQNAAIDYPAINRWAIFLMSLRDNRSSWHPRQNILHRIHLDQLRQLFDRDSAKDINAIICRLDFKAKRFQLHQRLR